MFESFDSSPATTESARSTPSTSADRMHVFVTVGSTRFDALVQRVLSEPVLDVLRAKGYRTLDVQCGNSEFDASLLSRDADDHWEGAGGLETSVWRFKPTLKEDYERADLIISHAGTSISRQSPSCPLREPTLYALACRAPGSGTIIDVLRLRKALIVIPNETLMDNHQAELSDALVGLGHLKSSSVADLPRAIENLDASTLVPFPQFDGSRFRELLDDEMGFSHSRESSSGAMPEVQPTTVSCESPQSYEDAHVHAVYDEIAPHFSSTRYKPWPIISAFLASLPTGWVGVDLGTGNGKYLPLPTDRPGSVWTIGLDRSLNLLKIAKRAGDVDREVVWADVLENPWRPGAFVCITFPYGSLIVGD
uniref:UDP-N-acetylglucosamine transferase subunit ALG13 n=1 Tax=Ganoderma boninense TaxID=34458 RepID=A0A5K1K0D7_9APHY|nr:Hormone-sensitive lipase [Ganoderma boninense]